MTIRKRRGITIIVVLGLIAITLALSYAMMRSQVTSAQIQRNLGRTVDARQTAMTGLAVGLRKMHQNDWSGVSSTLSGSLGDYQNFHVLYEAGDFSLTSGDADYVDLAYRVTVTATGTATDPGNPDVQATHQVRAVMRLSPVLMPDEPSDWATFQKYTVYQGESKEFLVELPSRIEGPVRIQGTLKIAEGAPDKDQPRDRYLSDLELARQDGYEDYRPFSGQVDIDYGGNSGGKARLGLLGVTTDDTKEVSLSSDWVMPTTFSTYQIYPGGPIYTMEQVSGVLENITLEPDPLTNPLGLFYYNAAVELRDNVTIRGTLFCANDLKISGSNVHLQPVDMPALYGTSQPVRLPVATCRDFQVETNASGSLEGLLAVFGRLEIESGSENAAFAITGRAIVQKEFRIYKRDEWAATDWDDALSDFKSVQTETGRLHYFNTYMAGLGRNPIPVPTVKPDSTPINYHWMTPKTDVLVYIPRDSDAGLYWDLIQWIDDP